MDVQIKLALEALERLDHTLCLNSQNLKFGIDTDYHVDCTSVNEMIGCIELIQTALEELGGKKPEYELDEQDWSGK